MTDERLPEPDRDDIRRFYRLLDHAPHGLTELRIIPPGEKPHIGYFDDEDAFVETCARWSGRANVYAGRNPRPRRFAEQLPQAHNQLARGIPGAKATDIECVTMLSLDVDPARGKNLPSTDAEHELALAAADRIAADYPNSVVVDSGNGAHILFPIPPVSVNGNTGRITEQIKQWEREVRQIVEDDPALKLDSIHDLARVTKVAGTLALKGTDTKERPHRRARFVSEIQEEPCDMTEVLAREVAPDRADEPKRSGDALGRFYDLLKGNEELRRVWEGQREDFKSRSEYDMSVASWCAGHGFALDETIRIVMALPESVGTHDKRRVRSTVRKVFKEKEAAYSTASRPDPDGLIAQVDQLRCLPDSYAWERHRAVADFVVASLKGRGFLVRDAHDETKTWYFENARKRLIPMGGPRFVALLHDVYGVSDGDRTVSDHVMAAVRTESLERGVAVEVRRLAHYDRQAKLLYVSRFDGQVYRLDGEKIDLVPNGTDGVLFADDPAWASWEYQKGTTDDPLFRHILGRIHFASGDGVRLTPDEQRALLGIWIRLLYLSELLPTKPIVLLLGEAGSGKTTAVRMILKTIFGPAVDVESIHRNKEDAFVASISGGHLVAFDNVDGSIDWLNDRLATCATGGQITLRKLYTTNETETFRPRCFLALTARTPRFRREDVADRLLLFRVERLEQFRPDRELIANVLTHRNEVLSGLIDDLSEIVRALRDGEPDDEVRFRMADFGTMAMFLARTADAENGAKLLRGILARMEEEQGDYVVEDEALFHALGLWLECEGNRGRPVTTRELFEELTRTAKDHGLYWPYKNVVSFGRCLASVWTALTRRIPGQRNTQRGRTRVFRFGEEASVDMLELGENDG